MWYGHGADSCITARVGEQLFEVVDLPDRNYTSISACQQILTIATEKHGLEERSKAYSKMLKDSATSFKLVNLKQISEEDWRSGTSLCLMSK